MEDGNGHGLLDSNAVNGSSQVDDLQRTVESQAAEITQLKASLADVTKRLELVEAKVRDAPAKSATGAKTGKRPAADTVRSNRSSRLSSAPTPRASATSRTSTSSAKPAASSRSSKSSGKVVRKSTKAMSKRERATYDSDERVLRLYIRGRPVNLPAPSDAEYNLSDSLPQSQNSLKLDWVHGYRGRDCRNNVHVLPSGEIIYIVAAVAILEHPDERTQRHYLEHTDDVKCIALHPDGVHVATGQVTGHAANHGMAHVRVWNSSDLSTVHVFGEGDIQRAVSCLSFSTQDNGQMLCCVDESNEHVLSVWDWQKEQKLAESKSSADPVLVADFHPELPNCLVTAGKNHVYFWSLDGGSLAKKTGIFEKNDKPRFVLCSTFSPAGDFVTGDSNGNIFIWPKGGNRIGSSVLGAHEGGIFSLCFMPDGSLISGGGKDRKLRLWDSELQPTEQSYTLSENWGAVRTIAAGGEQVFVGTTRNMILRRLADDDYTPLVQGHSDELWGIATHPTEPLALSAGLDKQLHAWDLTSHSCVWTVQLQDGARCVGFHPEGRVVCVGLSSGAWSVLDTESHDIIHTDSPASEQISCALYSPDGSKLAVGSNDNKIYVYSVEDNQYTMVGTCTGHSSFVTHIDWSADNEVIRSNSGDYEVLYWSAGDCSQILEASAFRDLDWATHYCVLAFNSAGIWPSEADGTDLNACARSNNKELIATADDFGKVNLFTYPCAQVEAAPRSFVGHSSHVTGVEFSCDDTKLVSTGGNDTAVFQWQIV